MKRKNKEVDKCVMCGELTREGWKHKGKRKVFYCGCEGRRCG